MAGFRASGLLIAKLSKYPAMQTLIGRRDSAINGINSVRENAPMANIEEIAK
jgi:hypothetical protein